MVRTLAKSSNPEAARRRTLRLRTSLVAVLLALTAGMAGCGDPDDDDDGGGGYVTAHLTVPHPAPGAA